MNKNSFHVVEKIKEILMHRYAVEKILRVREILSVSGYTALSFLLVLLTWLYMPANKVFTFLLEVTAILVLSLLWWKSWKTVGKFIPKFVLIGMLGWVFITVNFFPGLFNGQHQDNRSLSTPIYRMLSLAPEVVEEMPEKVDLTPTQRLDLFIAPGPLIPYYINSQGPKPEILGSLGPGTFRVILYLVLLITFILLFDLLLTVSTYRNKRLGNRYLGFFAVPASQREQDVKRKLLLLSASLSMLTFISLNYFIFFWGLSFIAAVFLFRWEILERGRNHKPLSRSVLFVILTQVFSALCGEILFILLLPLSTLLVTGKTAHHFFRVITLTWVIILGAAVTVLIGIITQVIWSGRRMTEKMKTGSK